jgi:hypothetical protein
VLPVAGDEQKREFSYMLSKQAYHNVSDGHLWFSIFARPASVRFSRVQRCTCCFVLLLTSMLFNILYYDQLQQSKTSASATKETKTTRAESSGTASGSTRLSLGPLVLSVEQVSGRVDRGRNESESEHGAV